MSEPKYKHNAEELFARYNDLNGKAAVRKTEWQTMSYYTQFRNQNILTIKTGTFWNTTQVFDFTASAANLALASGQLAYLCPSSEKWFAYIPRVRGGKVADDDAVRWFNDVSDITREYLAASNFYESVFESFIHRGGFGLSCLYVNETSKSPLNFKCIKMGTFLISENDEERVDTVFREVELTARVACQMFGYDELPEETRKQLDEAKLDEISKYIHYVGPVEDDGMDKKFSECYFDMKTKKIVMESEYYENPFIVSRFLKFDNDPYGYGPTQECMCAIKMCNKIAEDLIILGEKKARPPILVPDSGAYDVDSQAGGKTLFDASNPNATPKEWQTQGDYELGMKLLEAHRELIQSAYYVPLFNSISDLDRSGITATEIIARENEKLNNFSPTFSRLTNEFFNPLLNRVFGLLFRAGKYPPPPPSVHGMPFEVSYQSKIALALGAGQNQRFLQWVQAAAPVIQLDPTCIDAIDTTKAMKTMARNWGIGNDFVRSDEEIEEVRAQRAKAQQAQQQREGAQMLMENADKLAKAAPMLQDALSHDTGAARLDTRTGQAKTPIL